MAGETKKSIRDLVKGPNPRPFATFAASLLSNDWDTVEDGLILSLHPRSRSRPTTKSDGCFKVGAAGL